MDFLNQAFAQIRDLFQSMTPGSRIATGLLLVVAVVSMAYLFNSQTSGPDGFLMGGEPVSASQLPAMEAAFAKAGLNEYEIVANRIRIPRGRNAVYMGALADAGALPPNFGSYLSTALANESMFEGKHAKKMRMKVATQSELSLILRSMQGIENASVLYDVEEGRGLSRNDKVTATVSIKPMGSEPLDAKRVPMIRNLVAGAIAGLKRENVTVADLNGRTYTGGGEDGFGSPDEDPYYSRKHMVENNLKQQIDSALGYVPGVLVQVFAELNTEIRHIEEGVKLDPKTVAVSTQATTETNNQKGTSPGGRPGLAVQGPGGPAAVAGGRASTGRTTSTEVEKTIENVVNMVAHDSLIVEKQGLTPERVKVTVVVPSKYYTQVWNELNKPAEGEEPKEPDSKSLSEIQEQVKKNIQDAVVALLPEVPAGTDPYPQVTVTTFQSLAGTPLAEITSTDTAMAWVGQYWSTLGMTGLALFSLMMLRSMVKSVPSAPLATANSSAPDGAEPSLTLVSADEDDEDDFADNGPRLKRRVRKGPNLKDDLTEMVREDPEAAASILRNWINNAG